MTDFEQQVAAALEPLVFEWQGITDCDTTGLVDILAPRIAAAVDKGLNVLRLQGHTSVTESSTWWDHWQHHAHDAAVTGLTRGE